MEYNYILLIVSFVGAYLIGSVATAVWTGNLLHGIDVREHGSGNAGATNTIRVLGWKTGVPVLLIDIGKGFFAVSLPALLNVADPGSPELINIQIITGLIAITGHIFPLFANFRGGKGVATTLGVILAIHPAATLICLIVFIIVLSTTGYVSLGSIITGISFPIVLIFFLDSPSIYFKIFSVFIAIAIILTHKKNIERLIRGEENRLFRKKK